jgi:hypothetical protein
VLSVDAADDHPPPAALDIAMNSTLNRFERGFAIFASLYFTSTLLCQSLFISPDALANAAEESNPFDPIFSKLQLLIYGLTIVPGAA